RCWGLPVSFVPAPCRTADARGRAAAVARGARGGDRPWFGDPVRAPAGAVTRSHCWLRNVSRIAADAAAKRARLGAVGCSRWSRFLGSPTRPAGRRCPATRRQGWDPESWPGTVPSTPSRMPRRVGASRAPLREEAIGACGTTSYAYFLLELLCGRPGAAPERALRTARGADVRVVPGPFSRSVGPVTRPVDRVRKRKGKASDPPRGAFARHGSASP